MTQTTSKSILIFLEAFYAPLIGWNTTQRKTCLEIPQIGIDMIGFRRLIFLKCMQAIGGEEIVDTILPHKIAQRLAQQAFAVLEDAFCTRYVVG